MVRVISDQPSDPRRRRSAGDWNHAVLAVASAWAVLLPGCGPAAQPKLESTETLPAIQSTDLIAVDEDQPWLMALACPLVNRLRHDGQLPWLLAVGQPAGEDFRLIHRLAPQRILLLTGQGSPPLQPYWQREFGDHKLEWMNVGMRPMPESLQLAHRFWGESKEVVAAAIDEPQALLRGSALAAQLGEPLLIYDPQDGDQALWGQTLAQLHVERLLAIGGKEQSFWPDATSVAVERLDAETVEQRLLAKFDPSVPGTIVVARIPDERRGVGRTAWLAPYVSLVRGAPMVFCDSPSAEEVERGVGNLIREHGFRPRSVTILADYHSIGTHPIQVPSDEDPGEARYKVHTEPCMPMTFEQLVSVGVGRLPFSSLQEASTFYVRGLARERLLAGKRPRVLMISNPALNNMELPLCETISRLTVAELRNCGVHVDEFYRRAGDLPEIMDRADEANVIIYEGHTEHDGLLRNPAYDYSAAPQGGREALRRFDGFPVVILQSCDSLQNDMLRNVHGAGGVAILGSSTPIHSASGSGFAKAVYDAVLYRNATLGEALRDAQNYFFCLQDLKDLRHHRERAKSQRVALSFRLWGDPELRMLSGPLGPPRLAPVAAHWQEPGRVVVEIPGRRFPEIRNEDYVAEFFPGSEAAGMVVRVKDAAARRVAPVYFFRLPAPNRLRSDPSAALTAAGDASERAVFRLDPAGRFLYVLYLPEKETAHDVVTLPYIEKPPADGPRSQPPRGVVR